MRADKLTVHVDDPNLPDGNADQHFTNVDYFPHRWGLQIFPADSGPVYFRTDEINGFETYKLATV